MPSSVPTETLLERLREKTGKTTEELNAWAEEKTQKFSGLLSKEAAFFLLAREAGIEEAAHAPILPVPISELQPNQQNVDVIGVVQQVFPVKEFPNKNKPGMGKRASVLIADSTGKTFVTFWHRDTEKIAELAIGTKVLLRNLSVSSYNNQTQLNFGYRSGLECNPPQAEQLTLPITEQKRTPLAEITQPAFNLTVEGTVQEIFPLKEFTKATGESGKLRRFSLQDNGGSLQAVVWNEKVLELENIQPGYQILLENVRAKNGWQSAIELSLDSTSRIVVLQKSEGTANAPQQAPETQRKIPASEQGPTI